MDKQQPTNIAVHVQSQTGGGYSPFTCGSGLGQMLLCHNFHHVCKRILAIVDADEASEKIQETLIIQQ